MSTEGFDNLTWSAKLVKAKLGIDEAVYSLILTRLQKELETMGLLGQRLNTGKARVCLRPTFTGIYEEFPHIFSGKPDLWRDRCMLFLAQRNNYNRRRSARAKRRRIDSKKDQEVSSIELSKESDNRPNSAHAEKNTSPVSSLSHTIFYIGDGYRLWHNLYTSGYPKERDTYRAKEYGRPRLWKINILNQNRPGLR